MKILYVARHQCGDNDDEGAIAHALQALGHEVICIHEKIRHRPIHSNTTLKMNLLRPDLCLFHKWPTTHELADLKCPKVLWYFDLVDSSDPLLVERSRSRVEWFNSVMPYTDLAFCTDGDWVTKKNLESKVGGKYRWLLQGADERVVGRGTVDPDLKYPPILFAGMINHGTKRVRQMELLRAKYGGKIWVLGDGGPKYRKHGRELADIIANVKIVLAPSGPSSDNYWSNRIFQQLGFGAFLVHPYCKGLHDYYVCGMDYLFYQNDEELDAIFMQFLPEGAREEREIISNNGLRRTKERNLYRHRVEELLNEVKRSIG